MYVLLRPKLIGKSQVKVFSKAFWRTVYRNCSAMAWQKWINRCLLYQRTRKLVVLWSRRAKSFCVGKMMEKRWVLRRKYCACLESSSASTHESFCWRTGPASPAHTTPKTSRLRWAHLWGGPTSGKCYKMQRNRNARGAHLWDGPPLGKWPIKRAHFGMSLMAHLSGGPPLGMAHLWGVYFIYWRSLYQTCLTSPWWLLYPSARLPSSGKTKSIRDKLAPNPGLFR